MYLKFTEKDVLVILTLSLLKLAVGFISGMVIPVFPSLVPASKTGFNSSIAMNVTVDYVKLSNLHVTKNLCQIVMSPIVGYFTNFSRALILLLLGTVFQFFSILGYGLGKYYVLILGRVFEGISASLVNCAAAAFVAYRFKDHKQRGFVYGAKALSQYVGIAVGPAYSGAVFQYYGQIIDFLSFSPFIFIEIVFVLLVIFLDKPSEKRSDQSLRVEVDLALIGSTDSTENGKVTMTPESANLNEEGENMLMNGNPNSVNNSLLQTEEKDVPKVSTRKNNLKTTFRFLKDPYFLICVGTFPVIFISVYLLFSSLPSYMRMTFKSTEFEQGIIWIVTLFGYALGFISGNVVNIKSSHYRHLIIMGYIFLHALAVLCVPLMPTWWSVTIPLCIIAHVHLFAEVVLSPILAMIVETRHDSMFGVMSGIVMMAMAITGALGSYSGPNLLSTIGYLYMNIGLCVINVIYAPLFIFFGRFCKKV